MFLSAKHIGPVYLRLVYGSFGQYHDPAHSFEVGKGVVLADGQDVAILTSGPVLDQAFAARERLLKRQIEARIIDLFSAKPLDEALVLQAAAETGALVVVEEHSILGGVGSAVAELVSSHDPLPVERVGYPDRHLESAPHAVLVERYGPSAAAIVAAVERALSRKRAAKL